MTRLILIRHAKSGWEDPFADDHARVLTERGRNAATALGRWMVDHGYLPQVILCSDSARTIETMDCIKAAFDTQPNMILDKMLYHPSPDTILEQCRKRPEGVIAVIAHNPGIGMLADALLRKRPDHRRFVDYPTGATTVMDFDGDLDFGAGQLVDFTVPRDLTGAP